MAEGAEKLGEKLKRKRTVGQNDQVRGIAQGTRAVFVLSEIGLGAFTCLALADLIFGLEQGYSWQDVLVGSGMMAFGVMLYLACQAIFRFVADNY